MTPAEQLAMGLDFIEALTGSPDTELIYQIVDDSHDRNDPKLRMLLAGPLRKMFDQLNKLNEMGAAVFFQANGGGRKKEQVSLLRALWVDDDGEFPLPPLVLEPKPTIVVKSSAGPRNKHLWWPLKSGEPVARFTPAQQRLIAALHTDKSIHNLDRVMRMPGFYNKKIDSKKGRTGEPFLVVMEKCEKGKRFTIDEVLANYPNLPPPSAAPPPPGGQQGAGAPPPSGSTTSPPAAGLGQAAADRIATWLTQRGVSFKRLEPFRFRLDKCPLDPDHKDVAEIRVFDSGAIWSSCFHDHCGGGAQNWHRVKDAIGGWTGPSVGFNRGDHVEAAIRLLGDLRAVTGEPPRFAEGKMRRYSPVSGIWEEVAEAEAHRTIMTYAGLSIGDKKILNLKRSDVKGVNQCVADLASTPEFFHGATQGLAFSNGFVAVENKRVEFRAHSPKHLAVVRVPFPYNPNTKTPQWLSFLESCFRDEEDCAERILLLQEFWGACLVGIATQYQRCLVLVGEGGNGKSVCLSVFYALFPPALRVAIRPQDFGREYTRARLAGARVNIVGDAPPADIADSGAFKTIVTGDTINARDPYGRVFMLHPVAGHVFACNALPGTNDFSKGFKDRFFIMTWNRRFRDTAEQVIDLEKVIIREELPGVAAWAVAGALRLLETGHYTKAKSCDLALAEWQHDTDAVAAFVTDHVEKDATASLTPMQLYDTFAQWAQARGHKTMSAPAFWKRLRTNSIVADHTRDGSRYAVRLKEIQVPMWAV